MTVDTIGALKGAALVDFTGTLSGYTQLPRFSQDFVSLVRGGLSSHSLVIVDRGVWMEEAEPLVVSDHLNLTGSNPLVGPNHPSGERFPVVQGVYLTDCLKGVKQGIAAGLKEGVVPGPEDIALVRSFGARCCCYNLVPSMLIAAHAGLKVLGLVLPEGRQLSAQTIDAINTLTGGK